MAWEAQLNAAERERQESAKRASASKAPPERGAGGGGFLSLSRSLALDDLSVQLDSPKLRSAAEPKAEELTLAEGLAPLESAFVPAAGAPRYAPTRGERKRWSGSSKFSTGSTTAEADAAKEGDAAREAARAADLAAYEQLKSDLTGLTAGLAVVTGAALGALYGEEVAVSYGVGAAGGLLYLRLLSRSVDSTKAGSAQSAGEVLEGTVGGQRLLVPAILVAGWNRWNAFAAPAVGLELQIAPILAGFFTYKLATLIQLFRDLLPKRVGDDGQPR